MALPSASRSHERECTRRRGYSRCRHLTAMATATTNAPASTAASSRCVPRASPSQSPRMRPATVLSGASKAPATENPIVVDRSNADVRRDGENVEYEQQGQPFHAGRPAQVCRRLEDVSKTPREHAQRRQEQDAEKDDHEQGFEGIHGWPLCCAQRVAHEQTPMRFGTILPVGVLLDALVCESTSAFGCGGSRQTYVGEHRATTAELAAG